MQHKMRFQNERGVDSATTVELQGETIKVSRQRAGDNGRKSSYLTIHEAMALVVLLTRAIEDRDHAALVHAMATAPVPGTPDWAKDAHVRPLSADECRRIHEIAGTCGCGVNCQDIGGGRCRYPEANSRDPAHNAGGETATTAGRAE